MTTSPYTTGTRMSGKVALISGGGRGMGASHARAIVAQGGKVALGDLPQCDSEGHALVKELGEQNAVYFRLDVRQAKSWEGAVQQTLDKFGKLNVLILNAGILDSGSIERYTEERWADMMAVNLTGCFLGIKAAIPALKASAPSSIIAISSTAGMRGYPSAVGYATSKWGVRGLTKAVALDLAHYKIRANSVHPGLVKTPMGDAVGDQQQKHVAMKRVGLPHELSNLILFLGSDESSFCTGQEWIADGGETTGLARGWNL